jgi:ribonuclease P protein component
LSTAPHPDRAASRAAGGPFPRTARLLKPSDFTKVFKSNQASSDALFRILWCANDRQGHRLGMAVSRKVDRRAVGRNRIKRIIRERFRQWCAKPHGADPYFDVVVLPRPRAAQADSAALACSLERLWPRIGSRDDDAARARRAMRKLN